MKWLCILALTLVVAAPGCGRGPSRSMSAAAGREAETLLVLPLNVAVAAPPEIERGLEPTWFALERYLGKQGKTAKTLAEDDARKLWLQSYAQAGDESENRFDTAAGVLVRALAKQVDFDALVIPTVIISSAPMQRRSAQWDGARRWLHFEGDSRRAGDIIIGHPIPVASLHVAIYTPVGTKVHEARGGLVVLAETVVDSEELRFEFEPRREPFENPKEVRQGIETAFDPFLPMAEDD